MAKLRAALSQLVLLPRALELVWVAAPGWTLVWAILLILQGLLPVAVVCLTGSLVDSLVLAVGKGATWENARTVLTLAVLMAGLALLTELSQSCSEWVRSVQSEFIQDYVSALIHGKSATLDLAFYETPEFHDHLYRARNDAGSRPLALLESAGSFLQNGVTMLGMSTLLLTYGSWIPLALLMSTMPACYVVLLSSGRYHQWWTLATARRRWTQYYDWLLTSTEPAAELRQFGLGNHFQSSYQALREGLRGEHIALTKRQSLARLFAAATGLLISGTTMLWMVWRTLQGLVTLGDLVLFYQAFSRGQSLMRSLLGNMGQIYSHTLMLRNLFEFLKLEPRVTDPSRPIAPPSRLNKGISFRQISFRYPGSEGVALQDFSLTIPAGQVVAILGANGAGKSTLVKLLCRLYDPEAGHIELDGIDIRDIQIAELRRLITVLFQSPVSYHATAGQNIALSTILAAASQAEIEAAAQGAGAHDIIARLPQGYATLLGKLFAEGTELSAGEWQRIALARAFLRRSQILVLDEPTSFMDSWAEADWLRRFRSLAEGRTALIITHRFTVAMRADMIHVMHEGQIVESGSHEELVTQGGLYAQSWAAQLEARAPLLSNPPKLIFDPTEALSQ
jgi:ATP-binding cassette subfamily B protein